MVKLLVFNDLDQKKSFKLFLGLRADVIKTLRLTEHDKMSGSMTQCQVGIAIGNWIRINKGKQRYDTNMTECQFGQHDIPMTINRDAFGQHIGIPKPTQLATQCQHIHSICTAFSTKKPKNSGKEDEIRPPVGKINRFSAGSRALNGVDNPLHYVK